MAANVTKKRHKPTLCAPNGSAHQLSCFLAKTFEPKSDQTLRSNYCFTENKHGGKWVGGGGSRGIMEGRVGGWRWFLQQNAEYGKVFKQTTHFFNKRFKEGKKIKMRDNNGLKVT